LNRAGSPRCYGCRLSLPAQPKSTKRANSLPVLLGLGLLLISTVGVGLAFTNQAAQPSSNVPASLVAAQPADTPAEILLSETPTPTVSPTAEPTSTPVITIAPTAPAVGPTTKPQSDGLVILPAFPVKIPGVSLSYYNISGSDGGALLSAMDTQGAVVCKLSEAAACFDNTFKWTYQGTITNGVCRVTKVNFTANYRIILPHWSGPTRVPSPLVSWWKTVFAHIAWHESQHLAIARTYAKKYQQTISAGPCDQAGQNKRTNSLAAQLQAAQAAFDVRDHNNWSWPPYNG